MVMRVFVAGGTGVVGRRLVPQLVGRGHPVTATMTDGAKLRLLERLGADMDRWFATTNRLRTEGTDHLLTAAEATAVSTFVAQSYANWNGIREGGWVKTEEDPLDLHVGTAAETVTAAVGRLEEVFLEADGTVLRYGGLYGPGATDDQVELVRKRQFPPFGAALATARGCMSTTPPPLCWLWSRTRRGLAGASLA